MNIRMLKTEFGSVDGIRVALYETGTEYDLSATPGSIELAESLVAAGMADPVDAEVKPADAEPKPAKAKK